MATISFILDTACAGGGHAHVDMSLNGGAAQHISVTMDDLRQPLSDMTDEQRETVAVFLMRLKLTGLTRAQVRTALQNGFAVTI